MKFRWISGLVTAVIFGLGLNGAQAGEGHPDAIIKLRGDSFALGFGFSWGKWYANLSRERLSSRNAGIFAC